MNQPIPPYDPARVERRVAARQRAMTIIALATEEAEDLLPDAKEAFWQQIRSQVDIRDPQPPPGEVAERPPMTDAEARKFEKEPWPIGEHRDKLSGYVVEHHTRYAVWLASQTFHDRLRRYLRNPEVRRQLRLDE